MEDQGIGCQLLPDKLQT